MPLHRDDHPSRATIWRATPQALRRCASRAAATCVDVISTQCGRELRRKTRRVARQCAAFRPAHRGPGSGFWHALGAQQLRQHYRPRLSQQQSLQPCVACSRAPQAACSARKERGGLSGPAHGALWHHTAQRGRPRHQETCLSPDCTMRAMSSVAAACCRVCGARRAREEGGTVG